jgi:DNA-directed RNA polymerase specialized sigma24 family protein
MAKRARDASGCGTFFSAVHFWDLAHFIPGLWYHEGIISRGADEGGTAMAQLDRPEAPMADPAGSVTVWLGDLRRGGDAASQRLWERYFRRLVGLARKHLRGVPCGMADGEDAALNAFNSFLAGVARGRFPQLHDRDDLWRLLVVLTVRKATGQRRHEGRIKRGGPAGAAAGRTLDSQLDRLTDAEPDPALAVLLAEECRGRLEGLGDETLRRVAELRMAGYSVVEVAQRLGVTKATVDRKLAVIRRRWTAARVT